MIANPYTGPTECYFPGIEANERFAKNLLSYLQRAVKAAKPEAILDGNNLCDHIEENLAAFVLDTLSERAEGEDWWTEFVPLNIRTSCAQRQEEERNQFPREAYLCLIDLKTILEKNWRLFEHHFRAAGVGDKKNGLEWIDAVNCKYRRMAWHPLKRHVTGFKYSSGDIEFLRERIGFLLKLRSAIKPRSGPTPGS